MRCSWVPAQFWGCPTTSGSRFLSCPPIVAAVLALSMVVWMRFRGTEWRPTLEMAGAAIAAGVVMIAGYWLGIVAENDLVQAFAVWHALP